MSNTKPFTLELRGSLGIRNVADFAASLREAIDAHPAISLSAEALTDIDISALQALVAAHKSAARAGKTLSLPPAGALKEALHATGLAGSGKGPVTPEGQLWSGPAGRSKGKTA